MIGYHANEEKKGFADAGKNIFYAIFLPVVILILWEWAADTGKINRNVIPPPSNLAETFVQLVTSGKLGQGLLISFQRVIVGFLIASVIGIVLGFLMGLFVPVNKMLSSLVNILRPIPVIALIPIFIIILGIGEPANISIIIIGALWPILLNTLAGVLNVDRKLLEVAYVYRISRRKIIFKIILPSALYHILTGLRLGIGGAWASVVAAEMIGATSGIGYMIMFAKSLAQASNMYVLVLVIGVIGLLIDRVLLVFQKHISKRFAGGGN